MSGKTVLISGASSGLGSHFASVLARAGSEVLVLCARRVARLEDLRLNLRTEFPATKVVVCRMDVTDTASIRAAFDRIEDAVGLVNVLVNCAGIAKPTLALQTGESEWDSVLNTNLRGNFFVAREACARLVNAKSAGCVVNVASILGLRPGSRQSNYASAKAGLLMLTRVMAGELSSKGIRLNALCPGYFETEMNSDFFSSEQGRAYLTRIPPRRLGRLDELDGPLLLLASDASSFMTGSTLVVDLGHSNAAL